MTSSRRRSSRIDVVVVQGDIALEAADAIFSPDDTNLTMSGGASAALRDAGGPELYEAAQAEQPIDPGDVVVTPGYDLFADYVVHVASKPGAGRATPKTIQAAAEAALAASDERLCRDVVAPPIGGGIGGVSTAESIQRICEAAKSMRPDHLETLRLVARSSEKYRRLTDLVIDAYQ